MEEAKKIPHFPTTCVVSWSVRFALICCPLLFSCVNSIGTSASKDADILGDDAASSEDDLPPLDCDDGYWICPEVARSLGSTKVQYTSCESYPYIDLKVEMIAGDGSPVAKAIADPIDRCRYKDLDGHVNAPDCPATSPCPDDKPLIRYRFEVRFEGDVSEDAQIRVSFLRDHTVEIGATCDVHVLEGTAPDLCEWGLEKDNKEDKPVCNDVCQFVGSSLGGPSAEHPNGNNSGWLCSDNAGCNNDGTMCTAWCPSEDCDSMVHPEGCPQGIVEGGSAWVPASESSYANACQTMCEMGVHKNLPGHPECNQNYSPQHKLDNPHCYACWDTTYHLCRYPGDCGKPMPYSKPSAGSDNGCS
jgi:hypothetical protein